MIAGIGDLEAAATELGLPLVIKPAHEGSSIGIGIVSEACELSAAYAAAVKLDSLIIAEEYVAGVELTAAVLDDRVLPLVRIDAPEGRYDYANKYFTDAVTYRCPSGIDPAKEAEIAIAARRSFDVLGCRGWGRADLILRADGSFAFLEMNTAPGMTSHSLVPMAARAAGIDFPSLVLRVLDGARHG